MSESVSGVDAILAGLRENAARNQEVGYPDAVVHLQAAEAAVHATVREIETWLRESSHLTLNLAADEVARRFGGTRDT